MDWDTWQGLDSEGNLNPHCPTEAERAWAASQPSLYPDSEATLRIYRGVHSVTAEDYIPRVAESWTTDLKTAKEFGDLVLTTVIDKKDIVFQSDSCGESEVVVVFDTENYDYAIRAV